MWDVIRYKTTTGSHRKSIIVKIPTLTSDFFQIFWNKNVTWRIFERRIRIRSLLPPSPEPRCDGLGRHFSEWFASWWLSHLKIEKCSSNWIISPENRGENKEYLKFHHLVCLWCCVIRIILFVKIRSSSNIRIIFTQNIWEKKHQKRTM